MFNHLYIQYLSCWYFMLITNWKFHHSSRLVVSYIYNVQRPTNWFPHPKRVSKTNWRYWINSFWNYASKAVMNASGSILTNKYANCSIEQRTEWNLKSNPDLPTTQMIIRRWIQGSSLNVWTQNFCFVQFLHLLIIRLLLQ